MNVELTEWLNRHRPTVRLIREHEPFTRWMAGHWDDSFPCDEDVARVNFANRDTLVVTTLSHATHKTLRYDERTDAFTADEGSESIGLSLCALHETRERGVKLSEIPIPTVLVSLALSYQV